MNSIQSNNQSSLFGNSGGGGGGLFGGNNNNNNSGGSGTPMFGGKNTPNKGGMFGSGGGGGSGNGLFGGGGGGGLGNLGGNQQTGTVAIKYNPPKNKENILLVSVTTLNECRGKCLDELRTEDYVLMKKGQIPDNIVNKIKSNMQGGSTGMGSLSGNLMGSGNNNSGGGGGGLFGNSGGNNNAGGGGGLPNLALSRGNVIPGSTGTGGGGLGGSSGGGLFGGNNNNNNSGGGGGGLFGGNNNNNNNASGGGGGLFGNKGNTGNTGGGLFGGNNNNSGGGGGGGGLFGGNNNNSGSGGGGGGLFGGNNNNASGGGGGGLFGNKGNTGNTGGGLFGGNNNTSGGGGGGGLFGGSNNNASGGGGGGLFGNKGTTGTGGGGGLFGGGGNTSGGGGGLFGGSNTSGGGGGGLFGGSSGGGGGLFGGQQNQQQGNSLFPNQQQQQQGMGYNADILRALFENMDPSWRAKLLESWQGKNEQTQAKDGAATEKKDVNASSANTTSSTATGNYVPYKPQEPKIDSKEPGYGRKKTLNELAAGLANRSYHDQRSLLNESGSNFNGYSSYDIRGIKKIDESQKSYADGFGLPRRLGTHSVVRKLDHSQMNDHNSSYLDDHIEIQLRPKSLYSSKRVLEDLNSSRASLNDSLRKERKKNIYDNSTTIEIETVIQGRRLDSLLKFQFDRNVPVADIKRRALELLNESGALASYAQAPRNLEEIAHYTDLSYNGYVLEDDRTIREATLEDPVRVLMEISNERDAPKLTKAGYWTSPPLEELKKWDERSLKYVENFTVGNDHGRVEFLGETDVRGLDLDELVIIQHGFAEVYPEAKFPTEESKPRRGEKLNKPSIITLYNCFRKKSSKKSQELSTIQEDVEVLGYDEANGIYQMKVQHFTRYGFDASDDEEEEEEIKEDFKSSRLAPQFGAFMNAQGGVRGAEIQPQRRGIGFMEIDKDDDFVSQGSESVKLRDFITSGAGERQGKMIPDDELFEQSDEDPETQFRSRHIGGKHGQKAIKGNHGRIVIAPEAQEDEEDDFEEELIKAPETETGGDALEDKIEEETDFTLSKQSDLLNLADSFVAAGRERVDWSSYVNNMSRETKARCDKAAEKLGLLNRMTFEKIQGQINTRERPFYMNRSFRVGWTKDGLAMARTDGSVSLHKVVLHKEVGRQAVDDESAFDYERYKRNLPYLARNLYEPLMKSLISQSTNMEDLSQLSISDKRGEGRGGVSSFLKFPDSNGVANALKDYVENIIDRRALREEGDETRKLIYADLRIRDLEVLSLFNTLFGNFELNLWEHALTVEDGNIDVKEREDLARRMQRSAERERQNRFIRKHGLSKWLERKSGQFVEADLQNGLTLTEEILLYLSGKQIRRATEVCNANGLHNLAVLLSTLSTNQHSKEVIKQQLLEWEQSRVSNAIIYQDLYKFLSGDHSVLPLPDWSRLFGMDLWYFAKPNQSFDNIFANFYDNKLQSQKKTAQSYFKNPLEGPQYYDLSFILTGLHAKHKDFNTHKLLSPYTYTSDCLDVKFIWLIEEFLSNNTASAANSSDAMNIESSSLLTKERIEFKYRILHGFCYQLELLGLWEYAIYAILVASPQVLSDANKARYIRNIVQRNYKTTDIFNTDRRNQEIKKKSQKKEILIEQLGLKQNLLHESKAFKYLYAFRYTKAIKDFMKCGSWKKAYYTLCRKLAPSVICNSMTSKAGLERAKTSLNFLESQLGALETYRHTLETWEKEGSVILRVLREVLSQDNRLAGPQEGLGAHDIGQLVQLVNSLNDLETIQENDLGRIMVDKFRRELSLALLNRLSQNQFVEQQEKILECVEQLNKNIKEDKTQIGLRFIERDLQV